MLDILIGCIEKGGSSGDGPVTPAPVCTVHCLEACGLVDFTVASRGRRACDRFCNNQENHISLKPCLCEEELHLIGSVSQAPWIFFSRYFYLMLAGNSESISRQGRFRQWEKNK